MTPPITQPATTNSNSTTTGSSIPTNRLERDSKKHDRRSDLVCRVRYTNVLPDLPFDPKFLRYPFSQDRFVRYKPTSLEKNYRWDLLTEHDVGVEIDLINPDAYATNRKLTEEDEKLLEEETASPANLKRSLLNQRSVPWLRKTEYISTEQSSIKSSLKLGEVRSSSVKEKLREDSLKYLTKDRLLQIVEEGFETAKAPLDKHYSKPSVVKLEEWPLFPDFDNWKYPFAQVIFDDDPSRKDATVTGQEQMEEMSQAVIKALVDADNKEYIGYFLPTAETRAKRAREEQEEVEDPDESYDFKLIREYNWNRKDKTMSGFEENYFLSVKDDSIVYNELETRVRLSKRRAAGGGSKPANLRLIQRYRQFLELEEKTQRKRLKAFENEDELDTVLEEEHGGETPENDEEEENDDEQHQEEEERDDEHADEQEDDEEEEESND
ncbi:unnamed protein product [Rotaria magnacalcarata]|uniref:RNA polymerase II-associated factor 1 homolog n=1 Tax=Rotaria magnacalcarata TaxID=392030 RepID=A0A819AEK9_9BILA|nr:unnamed protein product [Rotaria magnacalcarata]CAF1489208.1 unnamed protein product [Rotaria magnacalcarata]CAF2052730.1 unnamed protein product [Rotaria magnacalcarata]CAF2076180.1 unnamed protein product [Rotaria magnacalcarata]CAF2093511.1 unnamed protein product [Rotaria magnacalcarata]